MPLRTTCTYSIFFKILFVLFLFQSPGRVSCCRIMSVFKSITAIQYRFPAWSVACNFSLDYQNILMLLTVKFFFSVTLRNVLWNRIGVVNPYQSLPLFIQSVLLLTFIKYGFFLTSKLLHLAFIYILHGRHLHYLSKWVCKSTTSNDSVGIQLNTFTQMLFFTV